MLIEDVPENTVIRDHKNIKTTVKDKRPCISHPLTHILVNGNECFWKYQEVTVVAHLSER